MFMVSRDTDAFAMLNLFFNLFGMCCGEVHRWCCWFSGASLRVAVEILCGLDRSLNSGELDMN